MTGPHPDAIVIGGGLHGLSAALHLALAGLRPLVLEKDHPGRHASGVNAGGVRRLGRDFAEVPLSVRAMEMWHAIEDLLEDDCGFTAHGQVKVAETAEELDRLKARAAALKAQNFDHEKIIDAKTLRSLVPTIAPHCVGATYCREDGAANPFRTVTAFRRRAQSLGATIVTSAAATSLKRHSGLWQVETTEGRFNAPIVVNAAGAWGAKIAAHAGECPPLEAHAPMLMITERVAPFLSPVLGAVGRALSFKQFDNGTVLIGGGHMGTAHPAINAATTRLAGLAKSAATVVALFPHLAGVSVNRAWAGLEGKTPDSLPILGKSPNHEGLFHSFGYSYHGFQLSPVTGKIIADLATSGATDLPIAPFRLDRFNDTAASPG